MITISIVVLFGCQRTQVRTYPEKIYPERSTPEKISRPRPTEPIPPIPPQIQTPQESGSQPQLPSVMTYSETVSGWNSYKEFVRWIDKDFSLDLDRFKRYEGKFPPSRTPEETFRLRSGIYVDVAVLARETLNRINPLYKARIVVIIMRPYGYNHYVCSFGDGGKIWILDYGTPYKEVTGLHGPYNSLQEYRVFYEKNHPLKRKIEAVTYLGK